MAAPLVVVGCAFWDTICRVPRIPPGGGKILTDAVVEGAGGMATAAAVAASRLGAEVRLWTRLGDDARGALLSEDLRRQGIACDHVRRLPGGRTWFSTILVDDGGERLVVAHRPPLDPDPSWLPLDAIDDAAAVLADMRWPQAARAVFARARALGIPTVLDADVAPREELEALVPLADHVLCSQPALAALEPGPPEAALRALAARIPAAVVGVTLGAQGALVLERGAESGLVLHRAPGLDVRSVDTLNAGDVWHGAYAFGLAQAWDLERRLRVANVAAAVKCERFGGILGAPDWTSVAARLASLERVAEGS